MRKETEIMFRSAMMQGKLELCFAIFLWVENGWDRYWPYSKMPDWLKEKYEILEHHE